MFNLLRSYNYVWHFYLSSECQLNVENNKQSVTCLLNHNNRKKNQREQYHTGLYLLLQV
nr:MAG TPA: hypothetical protein [Caudoviricetes sp.]